MSHFTAVRFGQQRAVCKSAKDGYIWLLDRFLGAVKEPQRLLEIVAGDGPKRRHFAPSPSQLYIANNRHLAEQATNYVQLQTGWFADVNISNAQKYETLCKVSRRLGLNEGGDWKWEVMKASDGLKRAKVVNGLTVEL